MSSAEPQPPQQGDTDEPHPQILRIPPEREMTSLMDLDLDLDSPWPLLDQISFPTSNPMSPLPLSSSEQPCSPLWIFTDHDDDHRLSSAAPAAFRLSDCSRFLSHSSNTNANSESQMPDEDNVAKHYSASALFCLTPKENPEVSVSCLIKERMTQALRYFKEATEQHILAQVWAPVKSGGRYVLTTSGQPFILDPHSNGLHRYRMVSLMYVFSLDADNDVELGLPGRVFRHKLPEWSPNVKYYSTKEYSRLNYAIQANVQGTLALPVFEPSGQSCVGVLELILTSQKINYAPEVDKVCKALQAVNLKSSEILDHPTVQITNEGRKNALAEILEILTVISETHKLPLAQTWVPCKHRSILADGGGPKKSCTSFDGSCMGQVCMSTTEVAFYVVDAHLWGFREACVEHHLQRGQGVAGRAFASHSMCFCKDVTQFCKLEYPLVHYARMFGLMSCFAICLRSTHTGNDEYVLEFFLPPSITDGFEQETLLGSMLTMMKQHLQSLRLASGEELEIGNSMEVVKAFPDGNLDSRLESVQISQVTRAPSGLGPLPFGGELLQLDSLEKQVLTHADASNVLPHADASNEKANALDGGGSQAVASSLGTKEVKKPERKRGKAEKTISLEVLQQYFAGSLKDAAKSLGVCPTTMKRICRQHGISRWPSRKINKVNRSLTKLKRVIESVQGAEGTFSIPLSQTPLPAAVGSSFLPVPPNQSNQRNSPGSAGHEFQGEKYHSPVCRTPESDGWAEIGNPFLMLRELSPEVQLHEQSTSPPEVAKGSGGSKTRSGSREESAGSPTSHGSCHGSPAYEIVPAKELFSSSMGKQVGGSLEQACQGMGEPNPTSGMAIPDALATIQADISLGGMLIEDAGSSKDLKNLCHSAAEAFMDERVPESSSTNPPLFNQVPKEGTNVPGQTTPQYPARQDVRTVTIKATYKEDIIRFRLPLTSGLIELREQVSKRLKLEVGTFDVKYLDDDHEWVLIACDADLQECLDLSRSSNSSIIRLLVHDITAAFGSSCESSGE
ncbi:PB1 domain [Dillenia turbinata]|uniref:PB1 domain n=1 Tax=Dillenia turbinata TaxID=194707 RepID=A0AAN8ZEZ7_9MAGN